MIEIKGGMPPEELICDKCINKRRYMLSESGKIYGVFCLSHNNVVSPVPDVCSECTPNYHKMAKDQHTLKLEF